MSHCVFGQGAGGVDGVPDSAHFAWSSWDLPGFTGPRLIRHPFLDNGQRNTEALQPDLAAMA